MPFENTRRIDCTPEEYFELPYVSNSDISNFLVHPRLFRDRPEKDSDALRFGSAVDCFLLTPDDFTSRYVVAPDGIAMPTTDMQRLFVQLLMEGVPEDEALYKAGYKKRSVKRDDFSQLLDLKEEAAGRDVILPDDWALIRAIASAVRDHIHAQRIIDTADKQVVFVADHTLTGLTCKCMIDLAWQDMVIDMKTTAKRTSREFLWQVRDFGYARQLAMYSGISGKDVGGWLVLFKDPVEVRLFDGMDHAERAVPDLESALLRLSWHMEHDLWDYRYEYYENEGWESL